MKLYWNEYNLFPYEKKLGLLEIQELLKPTKIIQYDNYIEIKGCQNIENLKRLTYFYKIEDEQIEFFSEQHLYEQSFRDVKNSSRRQVTRYYTHGLHEYKGKFNPQIVRCMLNIFGVNEGDKIIDPFCGSGTTLIEAKLCGINSIGTDINSLATFISNTKISSLSIDTDLAKQCLESIVVKYKKDRFEFTLSGNLNNNRMIYLKKWFIKNYLLDFECLRNKILSINNENIVNMFLIIASNLLRDYSLQEPRDLRIRRRKSDYPVESIIQAFQSEAENTILLIESAKKVNMNNNSKAKSINTDIREINCGGYEKFNSAITSPPYATALPYIDTQRLSLVWLNLCNPKEIPTLQSELIGSRELKKSVQREIEDKMKDNLDEIPENIYIYCLELYNSLTENDGFRRQAVPALLYRYFSDMKKMFQVVKRLLKKDAKFGLVVGHNSTTIGGKKYNIDTPKMLVDVSKLCGWSHIDTIPLETYSRYDIHAKNSIAKESLIILANK